MNVSVFICAFQVNWTEAMKNCESRGMELVSILSKVENDNVISSIKEAGELNVYDVHTIINYFNLTPYQQNVWKLRISDSGHGHIGFWTSGNRLGEGDAYYWSNRTQVTFTDWENGKPDKRILDGEEEECIEMKGFNIFKWNDNFCSHEMYYICETSWIWFKLLPFFGKKCFSLCSFYSKYEYQKVNWNIYSFVF